MCVNQMNGIEPFENEKKSIRDEHTLKHACEASMSLNTASTLGTFLKSIKFQQCKLRTFNKHTMNSFEEEEEKYSISA